MFIFSYVKDLASYQNVLFCVTRVSCFHTHPANLSVNLYISKFASFHALCPIFSPNMHNWSMWTGLWVYCVMNIRLCWQHIKLLYFRRVREILFSLWCPLYAIRIVQKYSLHWFDWIQILKILKWEASLMRCAFLFLLNLLQDEPHLHKCLIVT